MSELERKVRRELVRFIISKAITCPRTGELLDERTAVILDGPDGTPTAALSQRGWAEVTPEKRARLAELGLTVDESTVKEA